MAGTLCWSSVSLALLHALREAQAPPPAALWQPVVSHVSPANMLESSAKRQRRRNPRYDDAATAAEDGEAEQQQERAAHDDDADDDETRRRKRYRHHMPDGPVPAHYVAPIHVRDGEVRVHSVWYHGLGLVDRHKQLHEIRVVQYGSEPWVNAADLARLLVGQSNCSRLFRSIHPACKALVCCPSAKRPVGQSVICLNAAGLEQFIVTRRKTLKGLPGYSDWIRQAVQPLLLLRPLHQ